MLLLTEGAIRYRGIEISSPQIDFIRRLIAEDPPIAHRALCKHIPDVEKDPFS